MVETIEPLTCGERLAGCAENGSAMEIEYILKAVRRYLPVVAISVVLGVIAMTVLRPESEQWYESAALLEVVPPDGRATADADRYLASELVVLNSPPIAARAAEIADIPSLDQRSVSFIQIPGTDIVRVVSSGATALQAQTIANAFVQAYLERTGSEEGAAADVEETEVDRSVAAVEQQLEDLDQQIEQAMAPFVQRAIDADNEIPAVDQVAPAMATQRDVLLEQYRQLLRQRLALRFEPELSEASEVIQTAELPEAPVQRSASAMALAIPVIVVALGVGAATFLARSSKRVLDDTEVEDILGVPFAATISRDQTLRGDPPERFESYSQRFRTIIGELCVQVESRGALDEATTVLVTGSQPEAGTTTIATAIAARFGSLGLNVALVDLDFDRPELSRRFSLTESGLQVLTDPSLRTVHESTVALAPTTLPNVELVGHDPDSGKRPLNRAQLITVLQRVATAADVVVIDAGPTLENSAAAILAPHCQAVVLTIPLWTQERAPLELIARQLRPVGERTLPVSMPRLPGDDSGTVGGLASRLRRRPPRRSADRDTRPDGERDDQNDVEPDPTTTEPARADATAGNEVREAERVSGLSSSRR